MAILRDLNKCYTYNPDDTYNCSKCDAQIKNHVAKRFYLSFGDGAILCMKCLFRLHLELNDLFEQAPGLINVDGAGTCYTTTNKREREQ